MKKIRTLVLALTALLLLPAFAAAEAPGTIEWKANNKIYDAHGKFNTWSFTRITVPDGDLEQGSVEMEIDLASVWEKADALAEHLRQADFFNVAEFATAKVTIDRVKKTGDKSYEGIATVTMHGHTNEVPITFNVTGMDPLAIEGSATLSRTAFGIGEPYDASNDRSIVDDVQVMISAKLEQ